MDVALDLIDEAGDNPRERVGDVSELADSIRQLGLLQPLVLLPRDAGRFLLIAGHRRLAACRLAGLRTAPAVLSPLEGDDRRYAAMIVENVHRVDLTPRERALAYAHLRDEHGLNQREIGELIGKSASHVSGVLQFLKTPEERAAELAHVRERRLAGETVIGRPLADASPEAVVRKLRQADTQAGTTLTHPQAQTALRLIQRALVLVRDLGDREQSASAA